jgi:WhiB family redox-sensing transcriptional regulator
VVGYTTNQTLKRRIVMINIIKDQLLDATDALCKEIDPDLWFPPRDKNLYKPIADKAKAICYGKDGRGECPVRMQCLLFADRTDKVHGIWGGMSHRERAALKRKATRQGKTLEELAKKTK